MDMIIGFIGICSVIGFIVYMTVRQSKKEEKIDVKFLKDRSLENLEVVINDGLKSGWRPHGSVLFIDGYYILMIIRESEE